jgi:signal transduction histidine kinase
MAADGLVRTSEIAVAAVLLVLTALLLLDLRRGWRRRWPAVAACIMLFVSIGVPGAAPLWFVAFPLLAAVYPDGTMTPRWLVLPVVGCGVAVVGDHVSGRAWSDDPAWNLVIAVQLIVVLAQVHRYRRRASTEERAAVRWTILGALVTFAAFEAIEAAFGVIGEGPVGSQVAARLAVLPLLVAMAVGLVRPHLFDVDEALRLTVAALGTLLVLGLVVHVLPAPEWVRLTVVAVIAAPTALLAVRLADRLVHGGRPDVDRSVAAMLSELNAARAQHDTPSVVLRAVTGSLGLEHGRISGAWFEDAETGSPPSTATSTLLLDVAYRGEVLAALELSPRRSETAFTRRDRLVVDALVAQAGPALDAARTLVALRESRARTVAAREEERRRIRRELHDDLGPTLAGIALSAAALSRSTGDPAAARLHHDIRHAVDRSRELAYGLRPPVLDDHGLVAALHDLVGGPDVRIEADGPLDLPASVDLAALRIIQEAVTNSRRHGAPPIRVGLRLDGTLLALEVSDSGPGLGTGTRAGVGMLSISERSDEIGGVARYDRSAPGCRLLVDLPLETP